MDTFDIIRALCQQTPKAYAIIRGTIVNGSMLAYEFGQGTIIVVEAFGLPVTGCGLGIHAMHIHEGGNCSGSADEPFADTGGHYSTNSSLSQIHKTYPRGHWPIIDPADDVEKMSAQYVNSLPHKSIK